LFVVSARVTIYAGTSVARVVSTFAGISIFVTPGLAIFGRRHGLVRMNPGVAVVPGFIAFAALFSVGILLATITAIAGRGGVAAAARRAVVAAGTATA